jgi:four helix bundle protein
MQKQATGNRQQATGNGGSEMAVGLRRGADIAERLLALAAEIVAFARRLPRDFTSRHLASQIVRSGTSAGANYDEARAAESRADFIHKVRVAAKEMRETIFWLRLAERCAPGRTSTGPLTREATELAAILMASARTARANSP